MPRYTIHGSFHLFQIEDISKALAKAIKNAPLPVEEDDYDTEVKMTKRDVAHLYQQAKLEGVKSLMTAIGKTADQPRLNVREWLIEDKVNHPKRHKWHDRVQGRY